MVSELAPSNHPAIVTKKRALDITNRLIVLTPLLLVLALGTGRCWSPLLLLVLLVLPPSPPLLTSTIASISWLLLLLLLLPLSPLSQTTTVYGISGTANGEQPTQSGH